MINPGSPVPVPTEKAEFATFEAYWALVSLGHRDRADAAVARREGRESKGKGKK